MKKLHLLLLQRAMQLCKFPRAVNTDNLLLSLPIFSSQTHPLLHTLHPSSCETSLFHHFKSITFQLLFVFAYTTNIICIKMGPQFGFGFSVKFVFIGYDWLCGMTVLLYICYGCVVFHAHTRVLDVNCPRV